VDVLARLEHAASVLPGWRRHDDGVGGGLAYLAAGLGTVLRDV
jgi:hypothetical protein